MKILERLNAWQRLWLICAVLLLFPMVVFVDYRSNFAKKYNLTTERLRELHVKKITERENPICLKLIERAEQGYGNKFLIANEFELEHKKDNPCVSTIATIRSFGKIQNKEELVKSLEDFDGRPRKLLLFHVMTWVLVCAGMYGVGLLGRWVRRGRA